MFTKKQPSGQSDAAASFETPVQRSVPPPSSNGIGIASANKSDGVVIIGKGTRIVGEITDCSRVEIQGVVDGTIIADALIVREGGSVKGRLQARHAEIHGHFNGQLEIVELLDVRSTGRVEGELAYGRLAVAMGGHISGSVTNPAGTAAKTAAADRTMIRSEPGPLIAAPSSSFTGFNGANGSAVPN